MNFQSNFICDKTDKRERSSAHNCYSFRHFEACIIKLTINVSRVKMIDCTLVKFGLQRRNFHRIIHRVILADEYHESSYNNLLKLSLNEALGWCIPSEHGGRITFDIIISRSIIALARTEMVYRIESSDEMPPSRKQACPKRGNCGVIARNFYETRFERKMNTTKITCGF